MTRKKDRQRFWTEHDREDYACPGCGATQDDGVRFEVHHVDGNPDNGDPENLIALCRPCHRDEHGIDPSTRDGHWSESYYREWQSDDSPFKYL